MNENLQHARPLLVAFGIGAVFLVVFVILLLVLQFRSVDRLLQPIESGELTDQRISENTSESVIGADAVSAELSVPSSSSDLVGAWLSEPSKNPLTLQDVQMKFVFSSDGQLKVFIKNPNGSEEVLFSSAEYKVTKLDGTKGQIDVIALYKERMYRSDGTYAELPPTDATGLTGANNLLELTSDRLCIFGDVATPDPEALPRDQWMCLSRIPNSGVSSEITPAPQVESAPISPPPSPSAIVGTWQMPHLEYIFSAGGTFQVYYLNYAGYSRVLYQDGTYSYDSSNQVITFQEVINHSIYGDGGTNKYTGPVIQFHVTQVDSEKMCWAETQDKRCWTKK